MGEKTAEFKWVGNHAQDLASGRMLEPGEMVELSEDDAKELHNSTLIADDVLIPLNDKGEQWTTNARRRMTRLNNQEERVGPGDVVPEPEAQPEEAASTSPSNTGGGS